jgi:hypothetical protein
MRFLNKLLALEVKIEPVVILRNSKNPEHCTVNLRNLHKDAVFA